MIKKILINLFIIFPVLLIVTSCGGNREVSMYFAAYIFNAIRDYNEYVYNPDTETYKFVLESKIVKDTGAETKTTQTIERDGHYIISETKSSHKYEDGVNGVWSPSLHVYYEIDNEYYMYQNFIGETKISRSEYLEETADFEYTYYGYSQLYEMISDSFSNDNKEVSYYSSGEGHFKVLIREVTSEKETNITVEFEDYLAKSYLEEIRGIDYKGTRKCKWEFGVEVDDKYIRYHYNS